MTTRPLTAKQSAFVDNYLASNDACAALIAAGYNTTQPDNMAYQLTRNTRVQAEIARRRSKMAVRTEIDQDMLTGQLYVIATDLNEPGSTRVQAIVHLGKWLGYYTETKQININSHVTHALDTYTQEELVALRNQAMLAIEAEAKDDTVIEGEYHETE